MTRRSCRALRIDRFGALALATAAAFILAPTHDGAGSFAGSAYAHGGGSGGGGGVGHGMSASANAHGHAPAAADDGAANSQGSTASALGGLNAAAQAAAHKSVTTSAMNALAGLVGNK